jgi:hypothetical protein
MDDAIKRALEVAARAMNTPYHRGQCCQSVDGCTESIGDGPCMCRAMVAAGIAAFLEALPVEYRLWGQSEEDFCAYRSRLAAAVRRAAGGG